MRMNQELKKYLTELEVANELIKENTLSDAICKILNDNQATKADYQDDAERIAFQFTPSNKDKYHKWDTYYAPLIIDTNGQEYPSKESINEGTISYWRERAVDTRHPVLSCRYADLVFDFAPKICKCSFDYEMAQIVINSTIRICQETLNNGLGCKVKLKRAISLAILLNNKKSIAELVDTIINTEKRFSIDEMPGLWGYSFQWLVFDYSDKNLLSEKKIQDLLIDLNARLERLISSDKPNLWSIECATMLLAEYYSTTNNEDDLKKILNQFELAVFSNETHCTDLFIRINSLAKLVDIYSHYSCRYKFAREAKVRIVALISDLRDKGDFKTNEILTKLNIKDDDIQNMLNKIFGDNRTGVIENTILKISIEFIPPKAPIQKQLSETVALCPVQFYTKNNTIISNEDNYPVAEYGSINDDYDSHLLDSFSKCMCFETPLLRIVFEELKNRYSVDMVHAELMLSKIFRSEDGEYIYIILKSFWDKEYLYSSCLLVPFIESSIREIFRLNKVSFLKSNETGGYDVISLNKMLEHGVIKKVYGDWGGDVEYYLKALLVEKIGWNLRNDFAHGINKGQFMNEDVANRLMHVLFCLSLLKFNITKNS